MPVLVPQPADWCASFREAVLASLAEAGAATPDAVAVVDAFAAAAPRAEAQRFGDDWTREESNFREAGAVANAGPRTGGGAEASGRARNAAQRPARGARRAKAMGARTSTALSALRLGARKSDLASWLLENCPEGGVLLEVGCGAGQLSARLAKRVDRLVAADFSLRAVLQSRTRALAAGGDVEGVVLDAQALPFHAHSLDGVVAENVVDLLDAPRDFLAEARRVLKRGGRVLLTTPEPSLGTDDDGALARLAKRAGLQVTRRDDGLVWTRVHSARFVEVYLVQALALR